MNCSFNFRYIYDMKTYFAYIYLIQVPLARFLMMSTENDTTSFQLHAPQKGSYLLDIFASVYPTFEQCQNEEEIKYINICRFRINCHGIEKVPLYCYKNEIRIDNFFLSEVYSTYRMQNICDCIKLLKITLIKSQ